MRVHGARAAAGVATDGRPQVRVAVKAAMGGGPVTAWPPPAQSARVDALVLLSMGVFAVIGFTRGARREWLSLAVTAAAYVAVDLFWPTIASVINRLYGLADLAGGQGTQASPPSGPWSAAGGAPLIVPEGPAPVWQITVFVLAVLGGYLASQLIGRARLGGFAALVRLPDLVERLIGACMGAGTGYLVARFVLERLFPLAVIDLTGSGSLAHAFFERFGPLGVFFVIGLFILFGVLSLGSRGKQVYG